MFVYATDSNDNNRTVWSYTSEGIAVKAIDVSQVYLSASVDGTHTYNGKPQEIASSDITLTLNDGKQTHETVKANAATVGANFKVVQSGDHTNATKKATVTLVPQADGYTGQISTTYEIEPKTLDGTNDKLISEHMEATLLTSAFTYTGKVIRVKKDDIKLIDKETKEDLSNYIYADKDGYVSISAGNANNLATNVDDVAYARINLIIGTPETGKFKNYNITAEGDNHRTIETTNTFKVTSRDLSDVNVSIKAKTYNDKKKVTIDKNDITFTDKNGNTLDLYKDVVITVPDNATDIGSYKVTITPKELNKNVTGTTTADFNIVGTDISGGTFANEKNGKLDNKEYTGEQIVITKDDLGTLTIGGKAVSPTLYELVNGTNTNVEDGGYVIVKGLGDYAGSEKKITFAINPAVISEVKVTNEKVEKLDTTDFSDYKDSMKLVVKAKNGAKPAKEFTLVEGKDYKVKYECKEGNIIGKTSFINHPFRQCAGQQRQCNPLFRQQIMEGGPVTVTHPDIIRYFMTIPEACRLVLEAAFMGQGNDIFIFDMGKPVKITDMACRMIKLAGLQPDKDIEIVYTGLRPGEKLYEELLYNEENSTPTLNPKIFKGISLKQDYDKIKPALQQLVEVAQTDNKKETVYQLKQIVPEFKSMNSVYEALDEKTYISKKMKSNIMFN